jgi:Helix-turn-helix domain
MLLGAALTTTPLAAELDDVPAGSLYRHVALLTRAGLLHVVAEHRIRGTVERTYALRQAAAGVRPGWLNTDWPVLSWPAEWSPLG